MAEHETHVLSRMEIEPGENGGHNVRHHMKPKPRMGRGMRGGIEPGYVEPKVFPFGPADVEGPKPQVPEGHILHHVAKHLGIPHEVIGGEHEEEHDEKPSRSRKHEMEEEEDEE